MQSAQISCAATAYYVMDGAEEESKTKHCSQPEIEVIRVVVKEEGQGNQRVNAHSGDCNRRPASMVLVRDVPEYHRAKNGPNFVQSLDVCNFRVRSPSDLLEIHRHPQHHRVNAKFGACKAKSIKNHIGCAKSFTKSDAAFIISWRYVAICYFLLSRNRRTDKLAFFGIDRLQLKVASFYFSYFKSNLPGICHKKFEDQSSQR